MPIDATTVKKIAKLARIRLSEEEVGVFTRELSSMMHWIDGRRNPHKDCRQCS